MTTATIIQIAKICEYLSVDDAGKLSFYKGGSPLNKQLAQKIYFVRKGVEWCNTNDSDNEYLTSTANYLYALCGKYALSAQNVTGGGGSVSPVTPSTVPNPLEVNGSDFSSATEWSDSRILPTYTLQVFWNDLSRFLNEGTEWNRNASGDGIDILIPGFDATATPTTKFFIFIS